MTRSGRIGDDTGLGKSALRSYDSYMAPRPRWWHQLQDSKNEVILAVDLYNRSGMERQLEAFVVHMSIGWLKIFQAKYERDSDDIYIRDKRNRRQRTKDGDWLTKSLSQLIQEIFDERDPRRLNLEFFIGLRNKIEHRYERDIAALVSGKTQAYLLNYERFLTDNFTHEESLASCLRFPLFVSSVTEDAVSAIKEVRKRVPRVVLEYVQDYDLSLDPGVSDDQGYDFRIYLVPKTGPKTEADVAMSFVRLDELNDEQKRIVDTMQTVIKEKQIPAPDLETHLPTEVARIVSSNIGRTITPNDHAKIWKFYKVRPPEGSDHPERTKTDFCVYNPVFKRHVYTKAWINYLSRKLTDPATFQEILGRA